ITPIPIPLVGACSAIVGHDIFLIGGSTLLANGYENKDLYIYNTVTDTWRTGTPCPKNCIVGAAASIGTNIYVYGGLQNQTETNHPAQFLKYDTVEDTWSELPWHDGTGLYSMFMCSFGQKL